MATAIQTKSKPTSSGERAHSRRSFPSNAQMGLGASLVALAGAAVFNVQRSKQTERENPPRGQILRVDGVDLHYVDSGTTGPVVVLLHGNGTTLEDWIASGIFDELSKTARVIAFDRPGFGYSSRPRTKLWTPEAQAELLSIALRSLGAGRVTAAGHSFGTLVTLALALQHPELASAALLSGYYYPSARSDVLPASIPAIPIIGDIDRYSIAPLVGAALKSRVEAKLFAPAAVAPSWRRFPFDMTLRPAQLRAEAAEAALMVPGAARLSARYAEIEVPIHIVSGEGDRIVDHASQSARLALDLIPATLTSLPGVGHMVHHSATEEVLGVIRRALEDQAPIGHR